MDSSEMVDTNNIEKAHHSCHPLLPPLPVFFLWASLIEHSTPSLSFFAEIIRWYPATTCGMPSPSNMNNSRWAYTSAESWDTKIGKSPIRLTSSISYSLTSFQRPIIVLGQLHQFWFLQALKGFCLCIQLAIHTMVFHELYFEGLK